jgi:hypothetical protein
MQNVFFANSPTLIVSAGAVIPTLAIAFGLSIERFRRARVAKLPQTGKLLRPPGHSSARRLDDMSDSLLETWLFATASSVLAVVATNFEASSWGHGATLLSSILNIGIAVLAAAAAFYFFFRVARLVPMARSCRLNLRGEQVVGQALVEVADSGYRAYHNFPAGENWTLDHVAVGPQGVFLIETIARNRRRRGAPGHPAHEVHVHKNTLYFPAGTDSRTILQADRNAQWLANYLEKRIGEPVPVTPMVVLPGWCVVYKAPPATRVEVVNPQFMVSHLREQPDTLTDTQLGGVLAALEEKCRDVEF